jgi:serine O-acetyltransferase
MPDPVANAIGAMLEHVQVLDERVGQLCKLMHQLDSRMPELEVSRLELPEFCDAAAKTDTGEARADGEAAQRCAG